MQNLLKFYDSASSNDYSRQCLSYNKDNKLVCGELVAWSDKAWQKTGYDMHMKIIISVSLSGKTTRDQVIIDVRNDMVLCCLQHV